MIQVVEEVPAGQRFVRVEVRDDNVTVKAGGEDVRLRSKEVVPGREEKEGEAMNEFLKLRNIDSQKQRAVLAIEEEPMVELKPEERRRVRFGKVTTDLTHKHRPNQGRRPGKPILKNKDYVVSSAEEPLGGGVEERANEAEAFKKSVKIFMDKNMSLVKGIRSASQFLEYWRSFQKEPQSLQIILMELGGKHVAELFVRGIEYKPFHELVTFTLYPSC